MEDNAKRIRGEKAKRIRIGETRLMNCGYTATVIEYISSRDITVKFDDGTIVTKRRYRDFVQGRIKHPEAPMRALIKRNKPTHDKHPEVPMGVLTKRNKPTHEQLSEWQKKRI